MFNGNGVFERLYNWVTDKDNNIPITASRFDAEDNGFAEGLSTCITRDGQSEIIANIPMNSHKFTQVLTGNARTDSINLGQVQDNQFLDLGVTTGTADAYIGAAAPVITQYVATMRYTLKINATNLTTTPYLQLNGIVNPAVTGIIKKIDIDGNEVAVEVGDLVINGIYDFKRNTDNDAWIVLNPRNLASGSFNNLSVNNLTVGKTVNGGVFNKKLPKISNNVSDANNDIDFSAGGSYDQTHTIGWASTAKTKRLDSNWVAGTNQGGLDTGSKANNTYYFCYTIYNPTTNAEDNIFTATFGSPTLPSEYTDFCYVGTILTDASGNIKGFLQIGNIFNLLLNVQNRAYSLAPSTPTLVNLTVPAIANIIGKINVHVAEIGGGNTEYYLIVHPSYADQTPTATNNTLWYSTPGGSQQSYSDSLLVPTNSSGQIIVNSSSAGGGLEVNTEGWIDGNL